MPDREKVIKGLESQFDDLSKYADFDEVLTLTQGQAKDLLALLKEQEPKQIVRKQGKREYPDGSIDYFAEWYCPHCGKLLNRGFDTPWIEFCYKCGQAVKWK